MEMKEMIYKPYEEDKNGKVKSELLCALKPQYVVV